MRLSTLIILLACSFNLFGQHHLTLDELIQLAIKNNKQIVAASFDVESQKQLKKTSVDLPKTNLSLMYGQYNSFPNDNNITVSQFIPLTVFGSQANLNRARVASAELQKSVTQNEVVYQVKRIYYALGLANARKTLLQSQDSIFEGFLKSASLRYKTGETNLLEQATAEAQRSEVSNQLRRIHSEINVLQQRIKSLVNTEDLAYISISLDEFLTFKSETDSSLLLSNPSLAFARQQVEVANREKRNEGAKGAPELLLGFFSQTLMGTPNEDGSVATSRDRFTGIQVGLSIPLWFVPQQGRANAAEYRWRAEQNRYEQYELTVQSEFTEAIQRYESNRNSIEYYRSSALRNADLILKQSQAAFRGGEIGYPEFLLGLKNSITIKENYLQTLHDYNQSIIYLEYLSGKQ